MERSNHSRLPCFISAAIALAVILSLGFLTGWGRNPASANEASAFETNLSDWKAVDGSQWTETEYGFTSDRNSAIEDEPLKFLVRSGTSPDWTRSFRYEVEFVIDGYGAGLSLFTASRTDFYAVEVNVEGKVYFPSVSKGGWRVFAEYADSLSQGELDAGFNGRHGIVFEYNAPTKTAKITVDGTVRSGSTVIPDEVFGGYLGLYFEGCNSCCFTKAVFTELEGTAGEADFKDFIDSNMNFETVFGSCGYTAKGFGGNGGGDNPKCLAKSDIVIDGTGSFSYEVEFSYDGYGAGLGFNVVDEKNYAAVELNVQSHIYFPLMIDGEWQTFYANAPDMTEEDMARKTHTVTFTYDAYDWYAEVFVDGELRQEIYDLDPDVISGNLGLFFEDATAYYTKAVYTELETRTAAPKTAAPETETTNAPAPSEAAAPTFSNASGVSSEGENTAPEDVSRGNISNTGRSILITVIAVLAALAAVAAIVLTKRKKQK